MRPTRGAIRNTLGGIGRNGLRRDAIPGFLLESRLTGS